MRICSPSTRKGTLASSSDTSKASSSFFASGKRARSTASTRKTTPSTPVAKYSFHNFRAILNLLKETYYLLLNGVDAGNEIEKSQAYQVHVRRDQMS